MTPLGRSGLIKRLTGVNLEATRQFLLRDCFVPGKGFSSQYAGQETVSCATSAICIYALSETGQLSHSQKRKFQRILLAFRETVPAEQAGAFPSRTANGEPSAWTTGQAALALMSLGARWKLIRQSVDWLLKTQAANGGWKFTGTHDGRERLIYTFYPTLVLLRCRAQLGEAGKKALSRVFDFVESCEERQNPFWIPFRNRLRALLRGRRGKKGAGDASLDDYWQLFEHDWPVEHVSEDWHPSRFTMTLMCGSNYLLLRRKVVANHPVALLHLRYYADEIVGNGWTDKREDQQPKTWATALGLLTLHRWAHDLYRTSTRLDVIPTRAELVKKLQAGTAHEAPLSKEARSLIRRFSQLQPGTQHATRYQLLVRDVFMFLFGEHVLKDPMPESKTFLGTLRRDVTFRNAADDGPWCDWKREHKIHSVLIECKNREKLSYDDLRQTACYLGKRMGYLGILACRKTTADKVREILNWFVTNDDKYILVVNDEALIDWIELKDRSENPSDAIADLYRSLREESQ